MKLNDNYKSSAETPCPAEILLKDGSETYGCDSAELIQYRSDGRTLTVDESGTFNVVPGVSLSINGSDLTFDFEETSPSETRTILMRILSKEKVGGRQRLRIRYCRATRRTGELDRTNEGIELVIEEVSA